VNQSIPRNSNFEHPKQAESPGDPAGGEQSPQDPSPLSSFGDESSNEEIARLWARFHTQQGESKKKKDRVRVPWGLGLIFSTLVLFAGIWGGLQSFLDTYER